MPVDALQSDIFKRATRVRRRQLSAVNFWCQRSPPDRIAFRGHVQHVLAEQRGAWLAIGTEHRRVDIGVAGVGQRGQGGLDPARWL